MEKKVVVIGAGIAGLAAGCYGRMNGYRVRILEQDSRPGGLCTSWQRQGYTINGGLAMLAGSGPAVGFFRIWRELGVFPALRIVDYEHQIVVEGRNGEKLTMYNDIDRLQRHLLELAPEDKAALDSFIAGIRIFAEHDLPIDTPQELLTFFGKLQLLRRQLPLLLAMNRWKKVSVKQFAGRLKNPFLREAFYQLKALFSDTLPVATLQAFAAWGHLHAAGFPVGGGMELARAIERRFLNLGGEISYHARVKKIIVQQGRAVGAALALGGEERSDFVVSAADGRTTIFDMLDGRFISKRLRRAYRDWPVGPAVLMVALGVNRRFADLPHSAFGTVFWLRQPEVIGGMSQQTLRPMVYNFDPSLAPPGKTLVRVVLPADYDYWKALAPDAARYRAEKEAAATTVIRLLEQRFPGISEQVEMCDVATPLTFERYTGNWRGSSVGWDASAATFFVPLPKSLPGLKNFFMAGHWADASAGVPGSALSGRAAIQHICRQEGKSFTRS